MNIIQSMKAHNAKPQAEKDADLQALLADLAGNERMTRMMVLLVVLSVLSMLAELNHR